MLPDALFHSTKLKAFSTNQMMTTLVKKVCFIKILLHHTYFNIAGEQMPIQQS